MTTYDKDSLLRIDYEASLHKPILNQIRFLPGKQSIFSDIQNELEKILNEFNHKCDLYTQNKIHHIQQLISKSLLASTENEFHTHDQRVDGLILLALIKKINFYMSNMQDNSISIQTSDVLRDAYIDIITFIQSSINSS